MVKIRFHEFHVHFSENWRYGALHLWHDGEVAYHIKSQPVAFSGRLTEHGQVGLFHFVDRWAFWSNYRPGWVNKQTDKKKGHQPVGKPCLG